MRTRRGLSGPWVRALILIPTSAVMIVGLLLLTEVLIEDGHRTLGVATGYLDFAWLVGAFFFGPAWVTGALHLPRPPENDGPPRGGIVPLRTRTPADADAAEAGRDRPAEAARAARRGRLPLPAL